MSYLVSCQLSVALSVEKVKKKPKKKQFLQSGFKRCGLRTGSVTSQSHTASPEPIFSTQDFKVL